MKKVLGIGNALVDILIKLTSDDLLNEFSLPKGSMQLIDEKKREKILTSINHLPRQEASGGCASNTIHGLSQLGISTGFLGKVGNDEWGKFFRDDMTQAGIKPYLYTSNTNTGTAVALVSPDSERTFATYLGASVELTAADIHPEVFNNYNLFHIEGYLVYNHNLIEETVKMAKASGLKVSLDLASYNVVDDNLDFLKQIATQYVDILFANEEESASFTGIKDPEKALHRIAEGCEMAVVKLGKAGSLVKHQGTVYQAEAIKAHAIDTTGAGDLYAAGFLYGLIQGYSLDKCAQIGGITAGNVVQVLGAKMNQETWRQIKSAINLLTK